MFFCLQSACGIYISLVFKATFPYILEIYLQLFNRMAFRHATLFYLSFDLFRFISFSVDFGYVYRCVSVYFSVPVESDNDGMRLERWIRNRTSDSVFFNVSFSQWYCSVDPAVEFSIPKHKACWPRRAAPLANKLHLGVELLFRNFMCHGKRWRQEKDSTHFRNFIEILFCSDGRKPEMPKKERTISHWLFPIFFLYKNDRCWCYDIFFSSFLPYNQVFIWKICVSFFSMIF